MVQRVLEAGFVRGLIALIVSTVCVIGVLLVTAQSPSADEFTRGGAAGVVGYLALQLFKGKKE